MEKIVAVTFDIADQKCKMYNALEWHNFIADTREYLQQGCLVEDAASDYTLEELFDEYYGDEFWFEVIPNPFAPYAIAFDLTSEEFVLARSERDVEFYNEMAEDGDYAEEIFWAE
jgi:hypothetical protein